MSKSKVYLIGAGPGDLELMTLKGYRLICEADVVLYDHLIPMEVLSHAKHGAELISVGKFAGDHTLRQEKINALLVEKAKEGNMVVRLKGGDCYMFGRGGEEVEECFEAGVEFEVVPGVTSAFAAPCYAGIPPTHRDCTSEVAVVTGHRKEGDNRPINIPKAGTVIFLMSVSNIKNIVASLVEQGWAKDTPIAAVEHGTFYDQRVVKGTLDNFLDIAEKAVLRTPGLFIVGEVVKLQDKLDWFMKRPNVLVLGNHPDRYRRLGNIVHRRIIDCVAIDDYSKTDEIVKRISEFNWIVFTSVNGAKYLFDRLYKAGLDARSLGSLKIAAIGKSTAARLKDFGIAADLIPDNESSKGLVEEFSKIDVKGKKFLLPQAEISSKELPDGLQSMGADIEKVTVYKTVDIEPGDIDFDYIDQILFTSGSTVRAFVKHFGKVPGNVKVYCLGEPTLAVARENNIEGEVLPKYTDHD